MCGDHQTQLNDFVRASGNWCCHAATATTITVIATVVGFIDMPELTRNAWKRFCTGDMERIESNGLLDMRAAKWTCVCKYVRRYVWSSCGSPRLGWHVIGPSNGCCCLSVGILVCFHFCNIWTLWRRSVLSPSQMKVAHKMPTAQRWRYG